LNALTLLSQHVVEEALMHYDVGHLLRYWPATRGIENSNYFVRTTQGEYVLTLIERPPFAGNQFFDLLFILEQGGLPVPAPLPDRQGQLELRIQNKAALLQRRLPGSHVTIPTTHQLHALGRLIARMHIQARSLASRMPMHPRNAAWISSMSEELVPFLRYSTAANMRTAADAVVSLLARQDVQALPQGVIHGDIFRDNVLFKDSELSGIIDFHHASSGTLILDLAIAANDWCCDNSGQINREKTVALLNGYGSQRPLTRQELWLFSPFRLYAALSFWLSRLQGHQNFAVDSGLRTKNPHEMERITQTLLRGFDYFDERQLGIA
jgi:homoserine kinase type II